MAAQTTLDGKTYKFKQQERKKNMNIQTPRNFISGPPEIVRLGRKGLRAALQAQRGPDAAAGKLPGPESARGAW